MRAPNTSTIHKLSKYKVNTINRNVYKKLHYFIHKRCQCFPRSSPNTQRGHAAASQLPQNPDRHRCPGCQKWKNKADKCRNCTGSTGGTTNASNGSNAPPRTRPPTPRRFTSEVEIEGIHVAECEGDAQLLERGSVEEDF